MPLGVSLPSRERGLKCILPPNLQNKLNVAPLAGAWIEIKEDECMDKYLAVVAPLAGAWIEIVTLIPSSSTSKSLPSRERGLK